MALPEADTDQLIQAASRGDEAARSRLLSRHVQAGRRSVTREEGRLPLPEESAWDLACRLFARGSSPSARLQREELRQRVTEALDRLGERDREVLVLRHLERLSTAEIAAVLDVTEAVVYTRHLRALRRLRDLLGEEFAEENL